MKRNIFTVIVTYNSAKVIIDCLRSVCKKSGINNNRIIIVDNNSKDNTVQLIKQSFNNIELSKLSDNKGFSKAINIGIQQALARKADFIFLLNPDTLVETSLRSSIALFDKDNKLGVVSPLLKGRYHGQIEYDCGLKYRPCLGKTIPIRVADKPEQVCKPDLVSGCAMIISKEVIDKIGFFDERFFLYFEDSDFCLRARKAGFKIAVDPKSIVFHKLSYSFKNNKLNKLQYIIKSNFLFVNKHAPFYHKPLSYMYLGYMLFKFMMVKIFNE